MCFIVGGDRAGLALVLPTTEMSLVPCGQVGRGCGVQCFKYLIHGDLEGLTLKQIKFAIGHSSS